MPSQLRKLILCMSANKSKKTKSDKSAKDKSAKDKYTECASSSLHSPPPAHLIVCCLLFAVCWLRLCSFASRSASICVASSAAAYARACRVLAVGGTQETGEYEYDVRVCSALDVFCSGTAAKRLFLVSGSGSGVSVRLSSSLPLPLLLLFVSRRVRVHVGLSLACAPRFASPRASCRLVVCALRLCLVCCEVQVAR